MQAWFWSSGLTKTFKVRGSWSCPLSHLSLSIARQTKQVPEYTKLKGLEKDKLKQMVIQFLQNSGSEGARREFIYKYLKDVLPSNKTEEQQLRIVGRLLVEMNEEGLIGKEGLRWFVC